MNKNIKISPLIEFDFELLEKFDDFSIRLKKQTEDHSIDKWVGSAYCPCDHQGECTTENGCECIESICEK